MTATAVKDDQKRVKPTQEQTTIYNKREKELRDRFLSGVLDCDEVNAGLQRLMEATRGSINCNSQPEIPSWAHPERPIIRHIPRGMVDPSAVIAEDIFLGTDGDYLSGEDFVSRGQAQEGSANACAFDFYARPENWKYLVNIPEEVTVLVFTSTVFRSSDGRSYVRYLIRDGAEWDRDYIWLDDRFNRHCRVVRFASGPPN